MNAWKNQFQFLNLWSFLLFHWQMILGFMPSNKNFRFQLCFWFYGILLEVTNKWHLHGLIYKCIAPNHPWTQENVWELSHIAKMKLTSQPKVLSARTLGDFWAPDTPLSKEYFTKWEFQVQHRPGYPGGNWSCRLVGLWPLHRCQVTASIYTPISSTKSTKWD